MMRFRPGCDMTSLYQLTDELEAMRRQLIENGADDQTIADTLDGEANGSMTT